MRLRAVIFPIFFAFLIGSGRPIGYAPQQTEAGGGGAPFTLGDNSVFSNSSLNNPDEVYTDATGVTAGTTGTYDTCYYYSDCTVAGNAKIQVWDDSSPQSLICTSDAISLGESAGWISDDMTDDSCGTYTANDVVHITLISDCYHYIYTDKADGDWDYGQDTSGSYSSPPSSISNVNAGGGSISPSEPHSAYCDMTGS